MTQAHEAFEAANRFLEIRVFEDCTVAYRESRRLQGLAPWRTVKPDDDREFAVAMRIAARGMLRELDIPFRSPETGER
jgi:hypothetical protein